MIRLMDGLLRADGLDLRLTPYSVLATSTSEGFVQFIKANPLREVISNWGTVQVNISSIETLKSDSNNKILLYCCKKSM